MSVNNIGQSSLLTSYIEKQNNAAVQQNPTVQNPATPSVALQTFSQPQTTYTVQPDISKISKPETQNVEGPAAQKPVKKKLSKKMVLAGIGAAVIIAGIIIFALCSRKKPEVSPELETALREFVDTANDFFKF